MLQAIRRQAVVGSFTPDKWTRLVLRHSMHVSDQHSMVARSYDVPHGAVEERTRMVEDGEFLPANLPFHVREALIFSPIRKPFRQRLLILAQDIDRKRQAHAHSLQESGTAVDADQDQRRFERNRCERADRHPIRLAVL